MPLITGLTREEIQASIHAVLATCTCGHPKRNHRPDGKCRAGHKRKCKCRTFVPQQACQTSQTHHQQGAA